MKNIPWNKGLKGFLKGRVSPNKGHHHVTTDETRRNISLAKGGNGQIKENISIDCLCGCGKLTKKGNKYIHGHNNRNMVVKRSTRDKLSMQKIGDKNPVNRPEVRKKISESIFLVAKRGAEHPNWAGGISRIYPQDWTEDLKDAIRKRDGYACRFCCSPQKEGQKFSVHHIDYDKDNCDPDNLITLCKPCHTKTNYNRSKWQSYFCRLLKRGIA